MHRRFGCGLFSHCHVFYWLLQRSMLCSDGAEKRDVECIAAGCQKTICCYNMLQLHNPHVALGPVVSVRLCVLAQSLHKILYGADSLCPVCAHAATGTLQPPVRLRPAQARSRVLQLHFHYYWREEVLHPSPSRGCEGMLPN